jgi:hypothetical protein
MRLLISALAAAGIIGFSMVGFAADPGEPYTAKPKIDKPGRAIDDGTVQVGKPKKYGREIDDGTVQVGKPKKYGREIDDQKKAVKAKGPTDQPGRAVDDSKK